VGYSVQEGGGGFQTVVLAESADAAIEVAMDVDTWEVLHFDVEGLCVFPKDPMTTKD
jgi:hypothetical protein